MPDLSFAEASVTSRNAMLSAKISKTLSALAEGVPPDDRAKQVLVRGADLLTTIVQGSILIERKQSSEQAHRADLKAYSVALSVIESLRLTALDSDLTDLFVKYRDELLKISQGRSISRSMLEPLTSFFAVLTRYFYQELQGSSLSLTEEPLLAHALP